MDTIISAVSAIFVTVIIPRGGKSHNENAYTVSATPNTGPYLPVVFDRHLFAGLKRDMEPCIPITRPAAPCTIHTSAYSPVIRLGVPLCQP